MSRLPHQSNPTFPETLRKVYENLVERCEYERPTDFDLTDLNGLRFLSVWTGLCQNFDVNGLRHEIGVMTQQAKQYRLVQIVGDSGCQNGPAGIDKAKHMIRDFVDETTTTGQQTVLEYGYTASDHDANWIVNDVIMEVPSLSTRVVANVVHMSALAVEIWNCEALGNIRNFVLAYNDDTETGFGCDMWLSDSVMSAAYGDRIICIEGGPQVFAQAVSVCIRGVRVIAITGPDLRLEPSRYASVSFSAAYFLHLLCMAWQQSCNNTGDISQADINKIEASGMDYLQRVGQISSSSETTRCNLIVGSLQAILANIGCLSRIEVVMVGVGEVNDYTEGIAPESTR